jgi:hypothetical protein
MLARLPMTQHLRRTLPAALILVATTLAIACGGTATVVPAETTAPPTRSGAAPPARVAVIVMENHEYGAIVGARQAPFITRLAHTAALATQMYAITHPSLPNYLALTGGSTFGIDSDCTDCSVHATSLVDQLESKRLSWKAYMDGLPHPCFTGSDAGEYAKKHNPFLYYTGIARSQARCGQIVPLTQLAADEQAHALPRFLWISPDLCHDMHDCSVQTGDRFLAGLVPSLLGALGPHGVLFLTWDEGDSDNGCCRLASGGHIATIVAGSGARPGARLRTATDHYSVLRTIEDLYGLPRLRGAACPCTSSLQALLRR